MALENNINEKLLKPYDPKETESRIYKLWEESGLFNPDICIEKGFTEKNAESFCISFPPANVTGILHMGHALGTTIEDIMIRYNRMRGKRTLWVPGTDHAAIATQSVVEKELLKKENKSRYDLGREEFLKRVEKFADESHNTIIGQLKKMGSSMDWSREAFTFDEKRNLAVRTAFKQMYEDGLIYRGLRIVNWDPKGQTVVSDDEVDHKPNKAKFYTFKYSKDFPISISTTRPETKVGDTAVAVHPDDPRYKEFVGKTYTIDNFCGVKLEIKIIADYEVDKGFGTGALGVTPAHSVIDWEMAQKNNLPIIQVIDEKARMMIDNENLKGKKTTEAREIIVEWLKKEGLLEKEEEIEQNISVADRTGGTIEPLPKLQWFIDVNKKIKNRGDKSLKELMLEPIRDKEIKLIPNYFDKTYFHWIENLRDWCISRQIWYGHRIPVWYKGEEIYCNTEAPKEDGWIQDEDTLDTWFSSGLWTFSTLGWPEKTEDLKTYHPTNVLETMYDILFFWVARMILMSEYILGEKPFNTVYLHGMVKDKQGRKMSKSLGNGINPIEVIEKYGADAVRMSLIVSKSPGIDMRIAEEEIKGYKHFANKIWNITRFVLDNTKEIKYDKNFENYSEKDLDLQKERHDLIVDITKDMDDYKFYIASEKIYHYTWHQFADIILEDSKKIFENGTEEEKLSRRQFLLHTLNKILVCLHPFMPFITEEIWGLLPEKNKNLLIVEPWPQISRKL
ncbi:MAG: valine--tRNA ligase [Candidatus Paceibacterota bacterium]|jgi:valyl-tRNA synthetase